MIADLTDSRPQTGRKCLQTPIRYRTCRQKAGELSELNGAETTQFKKGPKSERGAKEGIRREGGTRGGVPQPVSSGKCKLKPRRGSPDSPARTVDTSSGSTMHDRDVGPEAASSPAGRPGRSRGSRCGRGLGPFSPRDDSGIPLAGVPSREMRTHVRAEVCT